jgi:hypothetical protein
LFLNSSNINPHIGKSLFNKVFEAYPKTALLILSGSLSFNSFRIFCISFQVDLELSRARHKSIACFCSSLFFFAISILCSSDTDKTCSSI